MAMAALFFLSPATLPALASLESAAAISFDGKRRMAEGKKMVKYNQCMIIVTMSDHSPNSGGDKMHTTEKEEK